MEHQHQHHCHNHHQQHHHQQQQQQQQLQQQQQQQQMQMQLQQQQQYQNQHQQQQLLIQRVKDANFAGVDELLKQGVNVDVRDVDGLTPLYWACCRGHVDLCRRLLRCGCDVNATGKAGSTALMACADNGHETCLRLLLQHRSIRLDETSDRGDTALHMAAYRGFLELVRLLCMAGASPGLHNVNKQTPLGVAFIEGQKECIDYLNRHVKNQMEHLKKEKEKQSSTYGPGHDSLINGFSKTELQQSSPTKAYSSSGIRSSSSGHPQHFRPSKPLPHQSCDVANLSGSNFDRDDAMLSHDSALGISVHSPPDSACMDCCNDEFKPYSSISSFSHDHKRYNNNNGYTSHSPVVFPKNTTSHGLKTHPNSPIEMDERPFFSNLDPHEFVSHNSHVNNKSSHSESGHRSNGSNDFLHYNNRVQTPTHRPVGGRHSSGYFSGGVNENSNASHEQSLQNNYSFSGQLSPGIDSAYTSSFSFTSVEDGSGPSAICYSPATDNDDHVRTIYSNSKQISSSQIATSANKRKSSVNNLSTQRKRNDENKADVCKYNIVSTIGDAKQNFIPNIISSTDTSLKKQSLEPKDQNVKHVTTEEKEVLPGLKLNSFIDNLQLRVIVLEESLDKERASKSDLKNECNKLKEENVELKTIIHDLTRRISEFS